MMITAISGVGAAGGPSATSRVGQAAGTGGAAGGDFAAVLKEVATGTVDTLRAGEAAAIGGIGSTRSVQDVVQAVMNAEQALQTAIAVRDKLVSAYQEITRMTV
jgi:flagellar hook-basal body complex protein FliE